MLTVPRERTATVEREDKFPSDVSLLRSLSSHPNNRNFLKFEQGEITDSPPKTIAQPRSLDQHIAFVENQHHSKDNVALRISGHRENLGSSEENSDDQKNEISKAKPADASQENRKTLDDPDIHHLHETDKVPQQPTTFNEALPSDTRHRSRSKPWSTRASTSRERNTAPYLSWQPTIGRNSAFVGLTAEQKEELGGIEYRSLKTLSWVLVGEFYSTPLLYAPQT